MKTKKINIPLSGQVVDLETARELTEKLASVGIEIESALEWQRKKMTIRAEDGCQWIKWRIAITNHWWIGYLKECPDRLQILEKEEHIPAYTLPEMFAVLPDEIEGIEVIEADEDFPEAIPEERERYTYYRVLYNDSIEYYAFDCSDYLDLDGSTFKIDKDTNPATAAAKLTIWLIDNGYIKGC